MKQAKQLLQNLPSPQREEALSNFDEEFFEQKKAREEPMKSTKNVLRCAFSWDNTDQGYDYWWEIHKGL